MRADSGALRRSTPDINNQPQTCIDSTGAPIGAGAYSEVDLLNKNLKYPQTLRATLGYDHQFGNGFVGTLEGMYTRGLNSFFYQNLNIGAPTGEDRFGRTIYATSFAANGTPTTNLVSTQFKAGGIYDVKNQSKDYSYQMTAQLKKRFSNALEASAAYTHGHSYSVQDITSSTAASNFRFGRELSGNLLSENTGISQFDIPNKVLIAGTYTAPWKTWQTNCLDDLRGHFRNSVRLRDHGARRGGRPERRRRGRQRSGVRAEERARSRARCCSRTRS